jgi:hypothetical protein
LDFPYIIEGKIQSLLGQSYMVRSKSPLLKWTKSNSTRLIVPGRGSLGLSNGVFSELIPTRKPIGYKNGLNIIYINYYYIYTYTILFDIIYNKVK